MSCNCNDNTIPQPCCSDCPQTNPCNSGCLDFVLTDCVESSAALTSLNLPANTKLDDILSAVDTRFAELSGSGDKFVRITSLDPVSGYLSDKISVCDTITKTTITEGGQQKLKLCINITNLLSEGETNPLFEDLDGLNVNYTLLVQTIIDTPALLQALCDAINDCTPTP